MAIFRGPFFHTLFPGSIAPDLLTTMKLTFSTSLAGRLSRWLIVLALVAGASVARAELSSYEKQIIASVLVLEAADQGEAGMLAVLHVINNRAGGVPDRAIGQVARHKAFTCLNSITRQRHPDYSPALRRAMKDRTWPVALQMVEDYAAGSLPPDITRGATHYCIHPPSSWRNQMAFTTRIGDHSFFREG